MSKAMGKKIVLIIVLVALAVLVIYYESDVEPQQKEAKLTEQALAEAEAAEDSYEKSPDGLRMLSLALGYGYQESNTKDYDKYDAVKDMEETLSQDVAAVTDGRADTMPVYSFLNYSYSVHETSFVRYQAGTNKEYTVYLLYGLGSYPVITEGEAEELLREGYFVADAQVVSEYIPISDDISGVLDYYYNYLDSCVYLMPYYRFSLDYNLNAYVPAVRSEYFTDSVSWGKITSVDEAEYTE